MCVCVQESKQVFRRVIVGGVTQNRSSEEKQSQRNTLNAVWVKQERV